MVITSNKTNIYWSGGNEADDESLRNMREKINKLQADFYEATILSFPVGRHVEWAHGNHIRSGRVLGIAGPVSRPDLSVVSRRNGGKPYRVDVLRVMDHMMPGESHE